MVRICVHLIQYRMLIKLTTIETIIVSNCTLYDMLYLYADKCCVCVCKTFLSKLEVLSFFTLLLHFPFPIFFLLLNTKSVCIHSVVNTELRKSKRRKKCAWQIDVYWKWHASFTPEHYSCCRCCFPYSYANSSKNVFFFINENTEAQDFDWLHHKFPLNLNVCSLHSHFHLKWMHLCIVLSVQCLVYNAHGIQFHMQIFEQKFRLQFAFAREKHTHKNSKIIIVQFCWHRSTKTLFRFFWI